jgi:hypothetical protein
VVGVELHKALCSKEIDIALSAYDGLCPQRDTQTNNNLASDINKFFHHDAPCLNIWHQFRLSKTIGRGKYVAFPIFELDSFNPEELHHLTYPDHLVVCSEWAKNIIYKAGIKTPTDVVELGVDTSVFHPVRPEAPNRNFVFLNVGKWEVRKGHDILVEAFNQAFTPQDKVELWMMTTNRFLTEQEAGDWERLYLHSPMGRAEKIMLIPWLKSQLDVVRVMQAADCGVFPARAEGWNLELLEMMACGKPVIATNYSAHTQFCNPENCSLIQIDNNEIAYDNKWFFGQGEWAELGPDQLEQLVHHMRTIASGGPGISKKGVETAKHLSWSRAADKLQEIIYHD